MKTIRTLVVEDEPMLAQILQRFASKVDGYKVVGVAYSSQKAMELIKDELPDLVLLDVYIDGSGIEILKKIRMLNLNIDVIMITAAKDAETVTECMRYGSVDYIVKPFEFDRLRQSLENYYDMHKKMHLGQESIEQGDIDGLKKIVIKPNQELPKNFDELTLNKIFGFFEPGENYDASHLAKEIGISYSTVKKYLDFLAETNVLQKTLKYSKRGRPLNLYALNDN